LVVVVVVHWYDIDIVSNVARRMKLSVVEPSDQSITNREPTKIPKSSKMALPVT